ncbi:survival motor neuron protein [Sitodiplosis mosellana]|uniref:survival motor neuron protein n=1 Tax=Sitodiplosis mosellana TaxID=263140 RepID=UPI002444CA04|nr:survival motor neuron protein [Sitodiplosis mosellana]
MSKKKSTKSASKPVIKNESIDEIWDDRLLIKTYELAVKLQNSDVAKSIASDTNKKTASSERHLFVRADTSSDDDLVQSNTLAEGVASGTSKRSVSLQQYMSTDDETDQNGTYKVGDYVRATYDVDNIDYEAQIISIDEENDECVVKFIGYDNEQSVRLVDLVDSWGEEEQQKQELEAAADVEESVGDSEDYNYPKEVYRNDDLHNSPLPMPPIPPMPPMLKESLGDESEHFSAMLMSWYMSGYYTGLYQGHKLAKQQQQQQQSKKSLKRK